MSETVIQAEIQATVTRLLDAGADSITIVRKMLDIAFETNQNAFATAVDEFEYGVMFPNGDDEE